MKRDVLHLLLASADAHRPILEMGLAREAAWNAPRPERLPRRAEVPSLERSDATPNDLPAQRWGVIAPEGPEGTPCSGPWPRSSSTARRSRERPRTATASRRTWTRRRPCAGGTRSTAPKRPPGGAAEVPPDAGGPGPGLHRDPARAGSRRLRRAAPFRGALGHTGPGSLYRLCAQGGGLRAGSRREQAPDVLLYTAPDGSAATTLGPMPCWSSPARRSWRRGGGRDGRAWASRSSRMRRRGGRRSCARRARLVRGVMLSVTHGLGQPAQGWASVEAQRALQGALDLGAGQVLTANLLRGTPFLPGGMWFCLACFGAATPPRSMFYSWLAHARRTAGL